VTHPTAPQDPQPGTFVGRWEIVRLQGRGGMATVYAVRDPATDERRALKLMNGGGPATEIEERFRREFRTLSRLHHPNITRVYDWGTSDSRPYFVMELVEGVDLRALAESWAADAPADRFDRVRGIVTQIASALEYVHLRGIVHRDVTPSNIMVLPDGTAKLMDFGVVKESGTPDLTAHGEVLGTVAYIAPEQISGGHVDARTDLYSLGAVLYLLLTGRRPFSARTMAGYLDKHLHSAPRPPRELVPQVPRQLDEICLRLLQKEPSERFASATHLLHVLEGRELLPMNLDAGDWPPVLAGRGEEIATLFGALATCLEGTGDVVIVEGAAGMGKTRLVQFVVNEAIQAGIPAIRVRARATGNPLDAYKRVYEALGQEGLDRPQVLELLFEGTEDRGIERYAVFSAFREMVRNSRPRVVAVDDLQWADAGSIELLEYLVRNTLGLAHEPILWILARTPGIQEAPLVGLTTGSSSGVRPTVIHLPPLTPAGVEELVLSFLPPNGATRALAQRLHREGDGNPAFVVEMIRGLVESGVIAAADGGRRLMLDEDEVARCALPIPRTIREKMLARLRPLSAGARRVAEVLAVARQEMTVALLADVADMDEAAVARALEDLVEAGAVRERRVESEEHYDFAHARTRDLLHGEIPGPERARLHRRIGEVLERVYRRRLHLVVEALSTHFEQGGVPSKAYPYLVRAGQRLFDRSFVAEAERHYGRAIALEPDARAHLILEEADRLLAEALLKHVEALDHLGRWDETSADLDRAWKLANELGNDALLSRAAAAWGIQARHDQDPAAAERWLDEARRLAERANEPFLRVMPLNGLAGIRWGRGDLEGARQCWADMLAIGESTRDDRSLAYGHSGIGLVALCRGQSAEARRCFEQSAEIFERLGLVAPLAVARVNLVEIHHLTGNLRRGLELADRTIAQARETHHSLGIARGRHHKSLLLVDLGRHTQAREEAEEALSIVRDLGAMEDELATLVGLARAAWATGDLASVRATMDDAMPLLDRYDPEGFAPIVLAWRARVAAIEGDMDAANAELQRALDRGGIRWQYQECRLDLVLARVYASMFNPAEATRRAESAIRRADACGFRLYALKGHRIAAMHSNDEPTVARHRRVADALARSLAANLSREDGERFLDLESVGATG
jgi:tetratricopeptide (TPR) repeat protein